MKKRKVSHPKQRQFDDRNLVFPALLILNKDHSTVQFKKAIQKVRFRSFFLSLFEPKLTGF